MKYQTLLNESVTSLRQSVGGISRQMMFPSNEKVDRFNFVRVQIYQTNHTPKREIYMPPYIKI